MAKLLKSSTGDGGVEVDTLKERVDLNGGLCRGGKGTLSTLTGCAETTKSTGVGGEILLVLALEFLDEVVDETVIKIFTTKMGITSGSLDFKDDIFDGQQRDIEGTTTQIEDEDFATSFDLLVKLGVGSR